VPKQIHRITPREFLAFAATDVVDPSLKGKVEALAQAKRAVSGRVDALLYASGLGQLARDKKWNFPERLKRLEEVGYSTPANLYSLIVDPRNELEHQYAYSRTDLQLRDVLELAGRYISNTDKYLANGVIRATELADGPGRPKGSKLAGPPAGHTVLVFDHDLGVVRAYLAGGVSIERSVSKLGAEVMVGIFRALLEAWLIDPTIIEPLAGEDAFLRLLA
jgi:hypothetical protein